MLSGIWLILPLVTLTVLNVLWLLPGSYLKVTTRKQGFPYRIFPRGGGTKPWKVTTARCVVGI